MHISFSYEFIKENSNWYTKSTNCDMSFKNCQHTRSYLEKSFEVHISRIIKKIITFYIILSSRERLETLKGWIENAKKIQNRKGPETTKVPNERLGIGSFGNFDNSATAGRRPEVRGPGVRWPLERGGIYFLTGSRTRIEPRARCQKSGRFRVEGVPNLARDLGQKRLSKCKSFWFLQTCSAREGIRKRETISKGTVAMATRQLAGPTTSVLLHSRETLFKCLKVN